MPRRPIAPICPDMDENDGILCLCECDFEVRLETRRTPDGRTVTETVERCTACGYVMSRDPLAERPSPPPSVN